MNEFRQLNVEIWPTCVIFAGLFVPSLVVSFSGSHGYQNLQPTVKCTFIPTAVLLFKVLLIDTSRNLIQTIPFTHFQFPFDKFLLLTSLMFGLVIKSRYNCSIVNICITAMYTFYFSIQQMIFWPSHEHQYARWVQIIILLIFNYCIGYELTSSNQSKLRQLGFFEGKVRTITILLTSLLPIISSFLFFHLILHRNCQVFKSSGPKMEHQIYKEMWGFPSHIRSINHKESLMQGEANCQEVLHIFVSLLSGWVLSDRIKKTKLLSCQENKEEIETHQRIKYERQQKKQYLFLAIGFLIVISRSILSLLK